MHVKSQAAAADVDLSNTNLLKKNTTFKLSNIIVFIKISIYKFRFIKCLRIEITYKSVVYWM